MTADDELPLDEPQDDEQQQPSAAATPRAARKQRDTARLRKKQTDQFWIAALGDEIGRRAVWELFVSAHTFEERFACGPNGFPQPEATWFQAGEQAFGLRLYQTLLVLDRVGVGIMHDEHDPRFKRPAAGTKKADE